MLDNNDDYSFGKGQQNITYGSYAVAQAIKTRLQLLKGEWWENIQEGLPLFQEILGTSGATSNIFIVDSLIKDRIIKTPNVLSIKDFNSKFEERKYSFNCSILSRFGEINLEMHL